MDGASAFENIHVWVTTHDTKSFRIVQKTFDNSIICFTITDWAEFTARIKDGIPVDNCIQAGFSSVVKPINAQFIKGNLETIVYIEYYIYYIISKI